MDVVPPRRVDSRLASTIVPQHHARGGDMARVNRLIELLEQDQPTFGERVPVLTHEAGVTAAQTPYDYLIVEFEHHPFDMGGLRAFMQGLVDGGPTRSGHRTPPVVVTLPVTGVLGDVVRANA